MRSMTNLNARGAIVLGVAWLLLLCLLESASGARAGLSLDPAVGPPTTIVRAKDPASPAGSSWRSTSTETGSAPRWQAGREGSTTG
jgi:hypothetical protein